jgi:hypothetical protein
MTLSDSERPREGAFPTHDEIKRIKRLLEHAPPWTLPELEQLIAFLEGLPYGQLQATQQALVDSILKELCPLARSLLQKQIADGLQTLALLLEDAMRRAHHGKDTPDPG